MDLVRAAKQGTWHTAGTQTSVPSFHYHCLPLITAVVIITMRFLRTFHFLPYPLNKWKSFLPLSVFQTVHEGLDFKTRNVRSRFKLKKELRPRLPKKGYCWDTQPFFLSSCLQKQGRRKTFFSFSSFFSKGWGASLFQNTQEGRCHPSPQTWASKVLSWVFFQNTFWGTSTSKPMGFSSPALRPAQVSGESEVGHITLGNSGW